MGPIPYTSPAPAQRRAANTQAAFIRSPRGPQVTLSNAFRIILWKFIILRFTMVDLENIPFCTDTVWRMSVRRLITRLNKEEWQARLCMMNARNTRAQAAIADRVTRKLVPLAQMTQTGVAWSPQWTEIA